MNIDDLNRLENSRKNTLSYIDKKQFEEIYKDFTIIETIVETRNEVGLDKSAMLLGTMLNICILKACNDVDEAMNYIKKLNYFMVSAVTLIDQDINKS